LRRASITYQRCQQHTVFQHLHPARLDTRQRGGGDWRQQQTAFADRGVGSKRRL
jgi:hypothetical protein